MLCKNTFEEIKYIPLILSLFSLVHKFIKQITRTANNINKKFVEKPKQKVSFPEHNILHQCENPDKKVQILSQSLTY